MLGRDISGHSTTGTTLIKKNHTFCNDPWLLTASKTEIELVTRPSWFQVAEAIRKEVRNEKREGGGVTGGAKHAGDNGGFVVVVIGNKTDSLPRAVDSTQV